MTADAIGRQVPDDDGTTRIRRHVEGILGVPATEGNLIDVLRNGDEIFPAMLEAVEQAEHTIDFLTFVYWKGEIGDELASRLCERARHGVRVRVLLDALGARPIDTKLLDDMADNGVDVRWFRPLKRFRPTQVNHRTHRKVLIVDEDLGFTGGVGIADEWRGDARNADEWRDTHFRIRGPAVDGLRAAFLDNWIETNPTLYDDDVDRFPEPPQHGTAIAQVVRSASETGWSDVDTLFRTLLQLAEHHVRITTAYFVPDDELCDRLCAAAERGVSVEILLPGPHADKRFVQLAGERAYERLLDHDVAIWSFQPSMLHAKVMTIDGFVSNIGSANLNNRSARLDDEVNLVVLDPHVTAVLDEQFESDLERSVRIERGRWERRSPLQHAAEWAVRPFKHFF
ncbi:phospholipase D-like domain-containing protein [Aquihabitans sp. McL0605]|uniref:phospholipase D-like domain-containing protein n=1 Tax=Aquihabitans sp. McL0605 TaxID=3415671 RepID=UPI003CF198B0